MKELKNLKVNSHEQHPFHLVDPSPWPLFTSFAILSFVVNIAAYFNYKEDGWSILLISFVLLCLTLSRWLSDIVTEATLEGNHTFKVQDNILLGMKLFIASEIMFFFSFFWAFFHFTLSPSIFIGGIWPPAEILTMQWDALPLLNTGILVYSGVILTWCHKLLLRGKKTGVLHTLTTVILLGCLFTGIQGYEWCNATYSIDDGVFGSIFYMLTGFHGIHVIIGIIFLFICRVRVVKGHFARRHHVGFTCAIWYWHFVDIVWIVVFFAVYMWGGGAF
jgi:heme/copper-type cytochrome/quinol oxidase subunit 3